MIEKIEVRKMLANYEKKLKEEFNKIESQIKKMNEACISNDMLKVWHNSAEYAVLNARKWALYETYHEILDMRCSEMLED